MGPGVFPQDSSSRQDKLPALARRTWLRPGTSILRSGTKAASIYDRGEQRDSVMLKEQQSAAPSKDCADCFAIETLDIRGIIQACTEMPPDVTSAELTRVDERLLDQRCLSLLLSEPVQQSNDAGWELRQQGRTDALSPYLDRILICVFIRLPGIHYTIEVDPELERVIYWEWQTT